MDSDDSISLVQRLAAMPPDQFQAFLASGLEKVNPQQRAALEQLASLFGKTFIELSPEQFVALHQAFERIAAHLGGQILENQM